MCNFLSQNVQHFALVSPSFICMLLSQSCGEDEDDEDVDDSVTSNHFSPDEVTMFQSKRLSLCHSYSSLQSIIIYIYIYIYIYI